MFISLLPDSLFRSHVLKVGSLASNSLAVALKKLPVAAYVGFQLWFRNAVLATNCIHYVVLMNTYFILWIDEGPLERPALGSKAGL